MNARLNDTGPINRNDMRAPWYFWAAVGAAVGIALILRLSTFTDPWIGVHNAWGGAFYSIVARNFLRYGALATSLAPVVNSGVVEPSQFEIYFHHPVLSMWLTAVSFRIFGIHEWSARVVPLVFSLMTMATVFHIAWSAYDRKHAILALLFMAVLPVDAYYATHVDPNNSISIFFTVFAVAAYRQWTLSSRSRELILVALALFLGCMAGWFTYLVIPGIVLHGWFSRRPAERKQVLASLALLPALAVIVFCLFMLHRAIGLSGRGPEVYDNLSDRLVKRTVTLQIGRFEILVVYLKQVWTLYTLPFVTLSAAWFVLFVQDVWRKRAQLRDWCIFLLWSYGVLYALTFPGHLPSHDFFVRTHAGGVTLAAAAVLIRLTDHIRHRLTRQTVFAVTILATCMVASLRTRALYAADDASNGSAMLGFQHAVAERSTVRDPVLLPIPNDRVMQYYLDRPTTFDLKTSQRMDSAMQSIRGAFLVLIPDRNAALYPDLIDHLERELPVERVAGLRIFRRP